MVEPTHHPDESDPRDRPPAAAGMAPWQKVVGVVGLLLVVVLAVLLLAPGGGGHGPGRHAPEGQEQPEAEGDGGHDPSQGDH